MAALGLDGFRHQNLCLVGPITAEGWPRISPTEVYFVEGELLLGMMPGSRKVHDLLRDPRLTVVTPQAEREPTRGDFKLYGRALDVTDPALRGAYGETIFAAIGWRPSEPFPLFAMDIERAAYIRFGAERRLLRWAPATGVQRLRHPDA